MERAGNGAIPTSKKKQFALWCATTAGVVSMQGDSAERNPLNSKDMIEIKKNDYVKPTEIREHVVQAICDAFLSFCAWSEFRPYEESCYRRATLLVIGHSDGKFYGFWDHKFNDSDIAYRVRGCEMREAFKQLRNAGYHIFKHYQYGNSRTHSYKVSRKDYLDDEPDAREVFEFTDNID